MSLKGEQITQTSRPREGFLDSLSRIMAAISSTLQLGEVLSVVCREAIRIFGVGGAAIYVFDPSTLRLSLRASIGPPRIGPARLSLEQAAHFIVRSFLTATPVVAGLGSEVELPQVYERRGFRSILAMPLIRDRRGIGILLLASSEPREFSEEEREHAAILAQHAAIAATNAMLFEKEKHKSEQLALAIQEAHHRIKNNLQTVAILLDLQMSDCEEGPARRALSNSIERINAISLVHELLSKDSDVRVIDAKELLDKLITVVATAATDPKRSISIDVSSQSILISSRRANSLALIAHELVANALEHGMTGRTEGSVKVSLRKEGDTVTLSVRDDGPGLPPSFSKGRNSRIGLGVVRTLAERDLQGKIELRNCHPGLEATLYFDDAGIGGDV